MNWKALAFLSVAAPVCAPASAGEPDSRPDILFVLIDSIKASHVGCYG